MSYYLYEPDKVSFEQFVINSFKSEGIKKLPTAKKLQDLVNPDFDNLLYIDGNEIYFEQVKDSSYYLFKINKLPEGPIDIRFGCELETCFILNCTAGEAGIQEALKFKTNKNKDWESGVIYHLQNNIVPYLNDEFKKRFTFAFVKGYHADEGHYVDLRNGNLVGKNIPSDEYKTLRFEPDGSIKCDEMKGQVPYPCEIISPILSSVKEIELLYKGLRIDENCTQSNKSMGFHVNISGIDKNGQMVELTRGMLTELIYKWIPYEKKNYRLLRGDGSGYAKKIEDIIDDKDNSQILSYILANKNDEPIANYEYFAPYGLNIWEAYKRVSRVKELSMTHWKNNNVIEFRIFPSKNDLPLLLSYTKDAMKIFKSTIDSYLNAPEKTLMNLQKTYLMYKHINIKFPIQFFEGDIEVWYKLCDYFEMYDILIYRKKTSWFFFEELEFKEEVYEEEWNKLIVRESKYKSNYYSYKYFMTKDRKVKLYDPVEISAQEFYKIYRKKNNGYF